MLPKRNLFIIHSMMSAQTPSSLNPSKLSTTPWFVYLLECRNGKLYTGITVDLHKRFALHDAGKGAKFTRINPPQRMIAATPCQNRSEATKLEFRVKALKPEQKLQLAETWPLREGLPVCRQSHEVA
jgi:putative endonuclease